MSFGEKLRAAQARAQSWLCVGLDSDPDKMPAALRGRQDAITAFNRAIVAATSDLVCAYKPNLAFYLAQGLPGITALLDTVAAIPRDIPILLDAKFGDIESSAKGYARFAFQVAGVDAVTASPYLGMDALEPFLAYGDRAVFVLAHTSNPGAGQLQDVVVESEPFYLRVVRAAMGRGPAEVGLVVGATFPGQLQAVREMSPNAILLIPGVGAQGGSLSAAVGFGPTASGIGPIINASRSVLYASGGDDYAEAARGAALKMRDEIRASVSGSHGQ